MSIESIVKSRLPLDVPRDKPQVDRVEHANFERRPGAVLHPEARPTCSPRAWARFADTPRWR
jgi:hypothetical protein